MNPRSKKIVRIILLAAVIIGLLLLMAYSFIPRLNSSPLPSHLVSQNSQLHGISSAIEIFQSLINIYPPSDAIDSTGRPYCGAMKLAEAMMGSDLWGFHRYSVFRSDGMNSDGTIRLYIGKSALFDPNIRKGPFLLPDNANAYKLKDLFADVGPFDVNNYVICDRYRQQRFSGKKTGMPLLYYKADTSKTAHDINNPDNPENIYNYKDNYALLALGVPGKPGIKHPLYEDPTIFYKMTRDYQDNQKSKPVNPDSFILLSAGEDGIYGTQDDLANFNMQWKPK
jgi:hypothetical protein